MFLFQMISGTGPAVQDKTKSSEMLSFVGGLRELETLTKGGIVSAETLGSQIEDLRKLVMGSGQLSGRIASNPELATQWKRMNDEYELLKLGSPGMKYYTPSDYSLLSNCISAALNTANEQERAGAVAQAPGFVQEKPKIARLNPDYEKTVSRLEAMMAAIAENKPYEAERIGMEIVASDDYKAVLKNSPEFRAQFESAMYGLGLLNPNSENTKKVMETMEREFYSQNREAIQAGLKSVPSGWSDQQRYVMLADAFHNLNEIRFNMTKACYLDEIDKALGAKDAKRADLLLARLSTVIDARNFVSREAPVYIHLQDAEKGLGSVESLSKIGGKAEINGFLVINEGGNLNIYAKARASSPEIGMTVGPDTYVKVNGSVFLNGKEDATLMVRAYPEMAETRFLFDSDLKSLNDALMTGNMDGAKKICTGMKKEMLFDKQLSKAQIDLREIKWESYDSKLQLATMGGIAPDLTGWDLLALVPFVLTGREIYKAINSDSQEELGRHVFGVALYGALDAFACATGGFGKGTSMTLREMGAAQATSKLGSQLVNLSSKLKGLGELIAKKAGDAEIGAALAEIKALTSEITTKEVIDAGKILRGGKLSTKNVEEAGAGGKLIYRAKGGSLVKRPVPGKNYITTTLKDIEQLGVKPLTSKQAGALSKKTGAIGDNLLIEADRLSEKTSMKIASNVQKDELGMLLNKYGQEYGIPNKYIPDFMKKTNKEWAALKTEGGRIENTGFTLINEDGKINLYRTAPTTIGSPFVQTTPYGKNLYQKTKKWLSGDVEVTWEKTKVFEASWKEGLAETKVAERLGNEKWYAELNKDTKAAIAGLKENEYIALSISGEGDVFYIVKGKKGLGVYRMPPDGYEQAGGILKHPLPKGSEWKGKIEKPVELGKCVDGKMDDNFAKNYEHLNEADKNVLDDAIASGSDNATYPFQGKKIDEKLGVTYEYDFIVERQTGTDGAVTLTLKAKPHKNVKSILQSGTDKIKGSAVGGLNTVEAGAEKASELVGKTENLPGNFRDWFFYKPKTKEPGTSHAWINRKFGEARNSWLSPSKSWDRLKIHSTADDTKGLTITKPAVAAWSATSNVALGTGGFLGYGLSYVPQAIAHGLVGVTGVGLGGVGAIGGTAFNLGARYVNGIATQNARGVAARVTASLLETNYPRISGYVKQNYPETYNSTLKWAEPSVQAPASASNESVDARYTQSLKSLKDAMETRGNTSLTPTEVEGHIVDYCKSIGITTKEGMTNKIKVMAQGAGQLEFYNFVKPVKKIPKQ